VPDEEWGERVLSAVLLQPGFAPSATLAEELARHCREHLAHYKCPRSVEFSEDLPRMPSGKIQRHLVRARYAPR
jgi:fatty-acyl-CoA synthase